MLLALAALLTAALAMTLLPARASALTLQGTVSQEVDGDTIKVVSRGFETPVRLIGIDTPETHRPGTVVQCFGPAASARTARLLPVGQRVRLETDPTQATRDRYGRLLAYVYRPGHSGPRASVNFALVATGYAKVYVYGGVPFRYAKAFLVAQAKARRAKKGLWGPPCRGNTEKPDPSAAQPGASTPTTPAPSRRWLPRPRPAPATPTTQVPASRPIRPTSTATRSPSETSSWSAWTSITSTSITTGSPASSEKPLGRRRTGPCVGAGPRA